MAHKVWHHHGQMSEAFRTVMFLSASGGLQDAYTYIGRGKVFANAQTGNIVLMSQAAFDGDLARVLHYLVPLLSFALGVAVAEAIHIRYREAKRLHWRQLVLVVEILLLFGVGFLPNTLDLAANALVSFACAMQVQAFRKVHSYPFASTMCIGNMRSGTEALCAYFHTRDKEILHQALTYFGVVLLFALGAGVGSIATLHWGAGTIWLSCGLLTVSFLIMFVHDEEQKLNE